MGYKNILVAVDLTEEADEVVHAAYQLAKAHQAKMTVATVVQPLTSYYGGLDMALITNASVRFEDEAIEQASTTLTKLVSAYDLDAEDVKVLLGHPPTEIRKFSEEMDADLVVIGNHGRHGVGILLGSTANALLHGIERDVLVVKIHPISVS